MNRVLVAVGLAALMPACSASRVSTAEPVLPAFMIGEFIDDYGTRYTIQNDRWVQHPNAVYHPHAVHLNDRLLVARNDAENPTEAGLWSRIDWLLLDDDSEYAWGFCYAAYQAQSPEAALAEAASERSTPRTGCNGFPFSRMKRVTEPAP